MPDAISLSRGRALLQEKSTFHRVFPGGSDTIKPIRFSEPMADMVSTLSNDVAELSVDSAVLTAVVSGSNASNKKACWRLIASSSVPVCGSLAS